MAKSAPIARYRIFDEGKPKERTIENIKLASEYGPFPECAGTKHYFALGSSTCQCKKYPQKDKK